MADTSAWVWTRALGGELRVPFDEDLVEGEIARATWCGSLANS